MSTNPLAASAEAEVVVRCACLDLSRDADERLRTLVDGALDWNETLRIARGNGLLPLLYHHLSASDLDEVPEWVRRELREEYHANTSANLHRTHELVEIFDRFEERGIPALPFKGPVLSQMAYGDLSLRRFTDLDVLVSRSALSDAVDVLESRGFEWIRDAPRRGDAAVIGGPLTPPICEEYKLRRERDGMMVELRWRVGNQQRPFPLDFGSLWERRQTVSLAGKPISALCAEDRFLALVYHGTKHYWVRLSWIGDIATLIQTNRQRRWSTLLERARNTGTERKLLVGAALAGTLLDSPLPDALERRIRDDGTIDPLVAEVCRAFRADPVRGSSHPNPADKAYFYLRTCESLTEKASVAINTAPIHPECGDYETLPLSKWLFPVYYLFAPRRILTKLPNVGRFSARAVRSLVDRL